MSKDSRGHLQLHFRGRFFCDRVGIIAISDPAAGGGQRRARHGQTLALCFKTGFHLDDLGGIEGYLAHAFLNDR